MKLTVDILRHVGLVAFVALAFVCLRQWRVRRSPPIRWAASAFGSLAALGIIGLFMEDPTTPMKGWWIKLILVVLMLYPYFLYRFATSFETPNRFAARFSGLITGAVIAATLALPYVPAPETAVPSWWSAYMIMVLAQWSALFLLVAVRLWRAARREATISRRRMRTLALAAVGTTLSILVSGTHSSPEPDAIRIVTQILSLGCTGLFLIGLSPPGWLLHMWRRRDGIAMQAAMGELFKASTQAEIMSILLPQAVSMIGARGAALVSTSGRVIARHGATGNDSEIASLQDLDLHLEKSSGVHLAKLKAGLLVIWLSPYAPFFGRDEMAFVDAWGFFVDLSLERCAAMEEQRTFIANAAHELRTPLTTILGVSSMLARQFEVLSPAQLDQCKDALDRQGKRAATLIANLLDMAQLENGAMHTSIEPVAISGVVKRALEDAPPPQGTMVEVAVGREIASADPGRLQQVLVNLLMNAYLHGDNNVRIEARTEQEGVVLTVADGGPGVREELVPHLFNPFVRGGDATAPGSGLGLALSKRLVEAFGGAIWYSPGTIEGARFNVRLPLASRPPAAYRSLREKASTVSPATAAM